MASLLGAAYDSSDDEAPKSNYTAATQVVAAPDVSLEVWSYTSNVLEHPELITP